MSANAASAEMNAFVRVIERGSFAAAASDLGITPSALSKLVTRIEDRLGVSLLKPDEEADVDTLGGLVFGLVGRVPARGELVRHPSGIEFEVLDADPRRVKKLKIHDHRAETGTGAGTAGTETAPKSSA